MPPTRRQPLLLDLDEITEYRVRLVSHHRETHTVFEGLTRFQIADLPRYRGDHGPRKMLTALAAPEMQWIAPADYHSGAATIDNGIYVCYFLDRWDEPDPAVDRARLEMALDVFCVREGLSGITWE